MLFIIAYNYMILKRLVPTLGIDFIFLYNLFIHNLTKARVSIEYKAKYAIIKL